MADFTRGRDRDEDLPLPTLQQRKEFNEGYQDQRRHSSRSKAGTRGSSRSAEWARRLALEEDEVIHLQDALHTVTEQLQGERRRADAAESSILQLVSRLKEVNADRSLALQEAAKAKEELRCVCILYFEFRVWNELIFIDYTKRSLRLLRER